MTTFIVHNRHPLRFLADIGWRGFLAFEIYVGSMILSAPLHSTFLLMLLLRLTLWREAGIDPVLDAINALVIVVGYGSAAALAVAGIARIGARELLLSQCALPFYWLLHSAAMLRAGHQLLARPYFWAKTAHGLTRMLRPTGRPAVASAPLSPTTQIRPGRPQSRPSGVA
jgi:hypothetical protein